MEEHIEKSNRLLDFGKQLCGGEYGWRKKFADKLAVSPSQMTNLLAGRDPIGASIQQRLRSLGADVDYILTGRKSTALAEGETRNIATDADMEMIRVLKSGGIDSPHKARALLQRDQQYRAIATGEPLVIQPAVNSNVVYSHSYSQLKPEKKKVHQGK